MICKLCRKKITRMNQHTSEKFPEHFCATCIKKYYALKGFDVSNNPPPNTHSISIVGKGFKWKKYIAKEKAEINRGLEPVAIVVAGKNIPANKAITAEMLARRQVPKNFVHANTIYPEEIGLIINMEVLVPIRKGDPILWQDLKPWVKLKGRQKPASPQEGEN